MSVVYLPYSTLYAHLNKAAAAALGMDGYVTVSYTYTYNETLTFAGTHAPAFILRVVSCNNMFKRIRLNIVQLTLGNGTDKNESFSKTLSEFLL
ncbi:hypothetical protein R3P38DRAFT_2495829 [Favolaschia claudopus]|uniref:Uncharacterized protein n=1 Tax=Favolaschia claudopus TaxID=2862362 RepID=A0AAW0E2Z0_9AGAR